jgi:competence protein ComEC
MTTESKTLKKIPFLSYALSLATGIILSDLLKKVLSLHTFLIAFPIIVIILFVAVYFNNKKTHKNISKPAILIFFVFTGIFITYIRHQNRFDNSLPEKGIYYGSISDKKRIDDRKYTYIVDLTYVKIPDSISIQVSEKIQVTLPDSALNQQLYPGHQIAFETQLYAIENLNNPGSFNYKNFLQKRGIRYQAYIRNKIEKSEGKKITLRTIAFNIRTQLIQKYRRAGIPPNEFAVLTALTLGDKNYLSSELQQSFAASGAMHVLAVSGLHVGIIYMIINMMFTPLAYLRRGKILKTPILILLLWAYAFISGLSPSVMRACTMFTFVIIGNGLGRKTNIYNTLSLSAFILMCINPQIIYEIGFQLSYLAVFAIVYFQPRIANMLHFKNKILKYLWELFAVSLAAQIGTFVISIYYFHQFPVYFWISNYIVIPSATLLLYGALLFFIFSGIPAISDIIAKILALITKIMNQSVEAIEQLPGSVISNIWIDKITMILLFAIIVASIFMISKKQFKTIIISLAILILLTTNGIFNYIKSSKLSAIIFYNTYQSPLMGIIHNKQLFYYTNGQYNNNTHNAIENSLGFFKLKNSIKIDTCNNQTLNNNGIAIQNQLILYKNTIVAINQKKFNTQKNSPNANIVWNTYKQSITLNKKNVYNVYTIRNKKTCPVQFPADTVYSSRKGAIILTHKQQSNY